MARGLNEGAARQLEAALTERFGEPIPLPRIAETCDHDRPGPCPKCGHMSEDMVGDVCPGCGMMPPSMAESDNDRPRHAGHGLECHCPDCQRPEVEESAPPGRERQVKALKGKRGIRNPWAVAWASYDKSR